MCLSTSRNWTLGSFSASVILSQYYTRRFSHAPLFVCWLGKACFLGLLFRDATTRCLHSAFPFKIFVDSFFLWLELMVTHKPYRGCKKMLSWGVVPSFPRWNPRIYWEQNWSPRKQEFLGFFLPNGEIIESTLLICQRRGWCCWRSPCSPSFNSIPIPATGKKLSVNSIILDLVLVLHWKRRWN